MNRAERDELVGHLLDVALQALELARRTESEEARARAEATAIAAVTRALEELPRRRPNNVIAAAAAALRSDR